MNKEEERLRHEISSILQSGDTRDDWSLKKLEMEIREIFEHKYRHKLREERVNEIITEEFDKLGLPVKGT